MDSTAFFEESRHMKPDYGIECVKPDEIACICYTSGTTGLFQDFTYRKVEKKTICFLITF